jgi:hypothetical protein
MLKIKKTQKIHENTLLGVLKTGETPKQRGLLDAACLLLLVL